MRYEARWCNGHHVLFDTHIYAPIDWFGLEREAKDARDWMNTQPKGAAR